MLKLKQAFFTAFLGVACTAFVNPPAQAAPILTASGATDIDIGGTLYDVQFLDGTCADVFGGSCITADFLFQTTTEAATATTALFALFAGTIFDTSPELTNGVSSPFGANILTPFLGTGTDGILATHSFQNSADPIFNDVNINYPLLPTSFDSSLDAAVVFAVWALAPDNAMPEPASALILSMAVAGLIGIRRRRRKKLAA